MNVLQIYAHPEPNAFTAAMRETLADAFRARGDTVAVSDLYALGFDPVVKAADFADRRDPEHLNVALEQRHALQTRTLAPDIAAEIAKVQAADLLCFTFPIYWFGPPAILKGWIERVWISGPFYGGKRIYARGGLAGKRAFAAMPLGGRPDMFGPTGIHGELAMGMMRNFFQGALGYVGCAVAEPYFAWHVPYVDDAARAAMLDDLRAIAADIESRPVLPMPDLDAFDDRFVPKAGV